eukprot:GCRY01002700.1.p1 GENE.GCRY01002700.1~~GCRY01002700.1.p1  ORF type:complete len:363 (+),score=51.23 GCRY01002700.1:258-1346(+)
MLSFNSYVLLSTSLAALSFWFLLKSTWKKKKAFNVHACALVFHGVGVAPCSLSGQDVLKTHNSGVYTVFTTSNGKISNFDNHIHRLCNSLKMKAELLSDSSASFARIEPFLAFDAMKQMVGKCIKIGVDELLGSQMNSFDLHDGHESPVSLFLTSVSSPSTQLELKFHVIISSILDSKPSCKPFDMFVHVSFWSRALVTQPVVVEVFGEPRSNALVKDVRWVKERHNLVVKKGPGVEEIILHHNGLLYEGATSNFYVIKNNTIYTAPHDCVLRGTILLVVEQACKELDIPIVYETPDAAEAEAWEAAFISSSSRILMPIREIRLMYLSEPTHVELSISPLFYTLESRVRFLLESSSTAIQDV